MDEYGNEEKQNTKEREKELIVEKKKIDKKTKRKRMIMKMERRK